MHMIAHDAVLGLVGDLGLMPGSLKAFSRRLSGFGSLAQDLALFAKGPNKKGVLSPICFAYHGSRDLILLYRDIFVH